LRQLSVFLYVLVLAGCGTTSASTPTATTSVKPTPTPVHFGHAPHMQIDPRHLYSATVTTTDGTFTIQLLPKIAPVTVNNFVFLARHHYYDHNLFIRVIEPFMIQTGDPSGTGAGGPGYEFKDELRGIRYLPGVVAMANHGKNTNGSQFFIVTGLKALSLSSSFSVFGHISSGWKVVRKIAQTPVGNNLASGEISQPLTDVYMQRVIIHGSP
jgi:cyclophilin family peptidyl-prolyl cis-trans isomerase